MTQLEFINTVKRLEDKMFRLAKMMLISTDEAADAVQEVFTKLWIKKEQLNNISNRDAYFMRAVRNYCLDRIKSKQAKEGRLDSIEFMVKAQSDERRYETEEAVNIIEQLLFRLPEKQRLIVQLRDIEGYEFKEIAQMLDMNENAVRTALSRARKTLKNELNNYYQYGLQTNRQYS
jgi:RNA polymerase sigma-70 factor (ECF subfamily)